MLLTKAPIQIPHAQKLHVWYFNRFLEDYYLNNDKTSLVRGILQMTFT